MKFIHHLNSGLGLCFCSFTSFKAVPLKMFMMNLMIHLIELISYDVNDSMDLISYLDDQHFFIVEDTQTSCLK